MIRQRAQSVITTAATLLERGYGPRYGVPEAMRQAGAGDRFAQVIAERHLARYGVDVFWSDLVCESADVAVAAMLGLPELDPTVIYGPDSAAILGILQAAVFADESQIRTVGYQLNGDAFSRLYDDVYEKSRAYAADKLMLEVLSDVHFAAHKEGVNSPAAVQAHLRGVRGFELAAAYYVLDGAGVPLCRDEAADLLGPVMRVFFPDAGAL